MSEFDEHDCTLRRDGKEDFMKQAIDSGVCISLRRKWCRFCTISRKHPETMLHFKSAEACKKEMARHVVSYIYMIHPFSLFNLYWEFFLMVIYQYIFLTYPINDALTHTERIYMLNHAKVCGDIILLADMIKLFFTGYYDYERSRVVLHPAKVAKKYLSTYFIIDVVSSFGSYALVIRWFFLNKSVQAIVRFSRFFDVFKIFRLPRWMNAFDLYRQYMNYSSYLFKALKTILTYFTILLWFYTITILVISNINRHLLNRRDKEDNIIVQYFSSTLSLLLVSCGAEKFNEESKFFAVAMFLCIGYVLQLFLYAQVLQIWNKFTNATNQSENLYQQFKEYMKYKGLPVSIRENIFAFFNFKFQNEFFSESRINHMVSEVLRQEILMYVTKSHVEKVEFFKNMPEDVLIKIVSQLKSEIFLPEDVIVSAGTAGNCMYFIYYGTVAVYTPMGKEICHLEDGAHFGEIALIFTETRVATVVAVTACELFKLNRTDFFEAMEPFPEMKNKIIEMAHDRLVKTRTETF